MYTRITPIVPVSDLAHAKDWFERCLGFRGDWIGDTGVHLHRGAANIRLIDKAPDMDMDDPRRQQSLYLNVDDVDAFYAEFRAALADSEVRPPFNRDYGAREVHVIYESLLVFVGQPLPKAPAP